LPLFLLTAGIAAAGPAEQAHAGVNGQQIMFACPPGLAYMTVKGHNQNGALVTWGPGWSQDGATIVTGGWWWIGNVTITYNAYNPLTGRQENHTQTANISQVNWPSTQTVNCTLTG
jgi:hypothetical protein